MNAQTIEELVFICEKADVVDLTHTMEVGMPAWPTQARYSSVIYESYDYGDPAIHSGITLSEHTGTHMDAPKHFVKNGKSIDQLSVKTLLGRGVFVEADYIAPKETYPLNDMIDFEKENGEIRKGDIVMFHFGWDKKWSIQPNGGPYLKDWPGVSKEVAEYLKDKEVSAVGCDALSLDAFGADNHCHHILLGNGIPIIENLVNLSLLPVFSFVIGLTNKFKDGSGSPLRIYALV